MNTKKKSRFVIFLSLIILALLAYFVWDYFSNKKEELSYSEFYQLYQDNQIASVNISPEYLIFTLKDSSDLNKSKIYKCQNPQSPDLQEKLMLKDVEVKIEKDGGQILSLIFDLIFYGIFIAIFIVVFRKFISPNTFKVQHKTGVKFDDVIGMDSLKKDMKQVIEIMKAPQEYAKKGIRMPKGILLEGQPGNGKTLFAKALAGEAKINFIPAKATDFESMFMAIGTMKVKLLLKKARRRAPCIVFIDEFDGIGTVRNYSGSAIETENTRIVTALLNELDGFEKTDGVLVLAATNSIHALDPALIRPGRFDAKFSVPYPDFEARKKLVELYCKNKSFSPECRPELLAKEFDGYSCAKIESILNRASLIASQENRKEFNMEDVRKACKEV
ncbi:MAG: ATP-dependent metallopeptidase FtsH/Yme1/Tma family protein [Treponema sp.]|nr:ATP-dependent metallopeptidase FtsH/Yme1/Tma family protein [Treponema sp.]